MNRTQGLHESRRVKPGLGQVLHSLGLDVTYHRGAGPFVYCVDEHGDEIEVLDLIAGYGTLLLGHNHPALIAEAMSFLTSGRPNHVQGSRRSLAEQLAAELARRTHRDDCVVFANSGTEAVEAAIKHALLETRGTTLLALEGAFHGKTIGSLQLTANPAFREMFGAGGILGAGGFNVVRVRPNDLTHLQEVFDRVSNLAGFVFEPILGEGGVRPLEREFVARMIELCQQRNVPAIADESQTGMGRTGTLLASEALGVAPHYIILSKGLGGGLAKISALLIQRQRYRQEFDLLHTSTFADDDFSCAVGMKVLELVDSPFLESCRNGGDWLQYRLRTLQQKYPTVIADVRGRGLMIGVELRHQSESPSLLLRQLSERGRLGFVVAGHLLKIHRIRVAPTLSDPFTLRVQPPGVTPQQYLQRLVDALDETCSLIVAQQVTELTSHLPESERAGDSFPAAASLPVAASLRDAQPLLWQPVRDSRARVSERLCHEKSPTKKGRFAWLFHLIDARDVPHLEPALAHAPTSELNSFLSRLAPLAEPIVMPIVEIQSSLGKCVDVIPILLPVTSAWLKRQIETRRIRAVKRLLERGIDVANSLGVDLVSLGQFTSIASGNGRDLYSQRMGLTTGNSYTTSLIVAAVRQAHFEREIAAEDSTLAVVGAAGNIGRACAELLGPSYHRVILVGRDRPAAQQQLQSLAHRIAGAKTSGHLSAVRAADVVVCATSSVEPILGPEHLRNGAIVCDASIPPTLRPETLDARPDLKIIRGGIVQLPNREQLDIPGLPLPPGYAFGCLAEGAILCFEGIRDASYTGRLCLEKIARITELAARHGFESPARECRSTVHNDQENRTPVGSQSVDLVSHESNPAGLSGGSFGFPLQSASGKRESRLACPADRSASGYRTPTLSEKPNDPPDKPGGI